MHVNRSNLNRNEFTLTQRDLQVNEVIEEYVRQKDAAAWFRGTSHYHILGSDTLFNALRDDGEQKTTHRVRTCLSLIGLKPMITSKQIMFLMRLSRGNDLVFLWFLMEMHYKTPKHNPKSYSVNEQLICSAICHLDMITTLRALDKILPKGHTSKNQMKKSSLKHRKLQESILKRKNETISNELVSPYFTKFRRPKQYGKCLVLKEPNFKVNFQVYSPHLTVQNESNRWYSDYHFNPTKRIIFIIISEIIKNIFHNLEEASARANTIEILCDYHKTLKIMAENLEHELRVQERDMCLKSYFPSHQNIVDKAAKIHAMLDHAVQQQLCKFNQQSKYVLRGQLMKAFTSDCNILDVIVGDEGLCNGNANTIKDVAKIKTGDASKKHKVCAFDEKNVDGTNASNYENTKNRNYIKNVAPHVHAFNRGNSIRNSYDYYELSDGVTPSEAVFRRSTKHKPFKFDYRKIFESNSQDDEKTCVRKMFLAALDQNVQNFAAEFHQPAGLAYDNAVKKCAKKIFANEVKRYEARKRRKLEAQKSESFNLLSQYPSSANYNAENYELMEQMLFDAFQYLRKNPKFVWAQLPDAHKVPSLREWIAHRFGKEYTPTEKLKSYGMSAVLFRAVQKSMKEYQVPNATQIGKNFFISYNCRNYLDKKVQRLKTKYYHRLDSNLLERTRIFWFAMRSYICSNGPPRKTFYAYMPSRYQDIHHFRLWKSTEYRDFKLSSYARRLKNTS